MTPLAIELILHCVCNRPILANLDNEQEIRRLIKADLVVKDESYPLGATAKYNLTPRGKALVAMICNTPLPEAVFVDPRVWNKSLGTSIQPPKVCLEPDLSAHCRHCGEERGYHHAGTERCKTVPHMIFQAQ